MTHFSICRHSKSICFGTRLRAACMTLLTGMALTVSAQRKTCIDTGWTFLYGNGQTAIANASVADQWRPVTLPHDWSVEKEAAAQAGGQVIGPFSTNSIGQYQTGFTVGGEGWYMRHIDVSEADLQGRVQLYFEGVYNQAYVYVNGSLCHTNVYGYSSFKFDVTERLHTGSNTILVRVLNQGNNSRWYAGSGIYRHVWLIRTASLYADEWDTYIQATDNRTVTAATIIRNESVADATAALQVTIIDANGKEVATSATQTQAIPTGKHAEVSCLLTVTDAATWSPEHPNLYRARIRIINDAGVTADEFVKTFGFRTLAFSATKGFLLNGQPTLLRGGCLHHDNGLLGAAAFDKAERRKLSILKAQGYNAVRCSHNIPSENFLDVCDELGLMVIDEAFDQWLLAKNSDDYHRYFATHSDDDLSVMLRRDRNHPSIIMWSIGNEIPGRIEPTGKAAAERLRAGILKLDTTRPVTAAICGWDAGDAWNSAGQNWRVQSAEAFSSLDVGGYNYMYHEYKNDHAAYPNRVMFGAESYPKQTSENWNLVESLPYVIGDFVWTAVDYLGEAGIGSANASAQPSMFQGWPFFNGWCGDIDLIGQKKPQSYYRDVVWRQAPVTMAVQPTASYNSAWGWQLEEQSWTWPGYEGKKVGINVYSRAPRVRLYLNGKQVGEQTPGNTFWAGFNIEYQPGTLRVVNLNSTGQEVAGEAFELRTTGMGTRLRVTYDSPVISAETNDLVYATIELVDDEGQVVVSDCSTRIKITNSGCGELLACGTASPNDMHSFRSTSPTLFRGRALAIVRSNGVAGPVSINAEFVKEEKTFTHHFLKNPSFGIEELDGWIISDRSYIRHHEGTWNNSLLNDFMECSADWGTANTLANQAISQSTKVIPAGKYTVTFDYNAAIRLSGKSHQTDGTMRGVAASVGGTRQALTSISPDKPQQAELTFTLAKPQAVSFLLEFSSGTNADWFALDNVTFAYEGPYDFDTSYLDKSAAIPAFDGSNWPRLSGNEAAGYTEAKLGSTYYNGTGLAFWSASAPTNRDLFSQAISGLPEGTYGLAAFAAANRWNGSDDDRNHQHGTMLFANTTNGTEVQTEVTTATYGLHSLVFDVRPSETVTIGLHAAANNGNNWCYLANVTLVRLAELNSIPEGISPSNATAAPLHVYDLSGRSLPGLSAVMPGHIYIANGKKAVSL